MEYNTYFIVIVAILIFDFVFEWVLDFLNVKRMSPEIPKELEGIYKAEEYSKQQKYMSENIRFGKISSLVSLAITIVVLFTGTLGWVDAWVKSFADHYILNALVFFGVVGFVSQLISLPFDVYSTFVIEEKYGFNKTTPKIFILDKVKGGLLSIIIGGGLFALILVIYNATQEWFWLLAFGVVALFTLFITMFYTSLLLPLFNKQTPLEEGELRNSIQQMANKVGFKLDNIFVMDGSKRSSKANAFFSGLGFKKRIVLYDTLIKDLNTNEIVGVLAHEIGHYKKKHTRSSLIISLCSMLVMFYVLSLFVGNEALCEALGATEPSFHISLLAFGMLYSPVSFLLGIGMNVLSRRNEFEADDFARENHNAESLIGALKKLSVKSLSNLTPHPLYVYFNYSHPTLVQRMANLTQNK